MAEQHPCRRGGGKPCGNVKKCYICFSFATNAKSNERWGGDGKLRRGLKPPKTAPIAPAKLRELRPPGRLRKIGNFVVAAARHALSGFARAGVTEEGRRLDICRACPFLKDGECLRCGCPVERKAPWRSAKCPEKKW